MHIKKRIVYKQPIEKLLPFYLDPHFLEIKFNHLGNRNIEIETISKNTVQHILKVEREIKVHPPKSIERFFKP